MKTLSRTILMTVLALTAGMLVACQNDKAPPAVEGDTVTRFDYPNITAEGGLARYLRYGEPVVVPSDDVRPMRVTVPVRSVWDKYALNVQYRFEFFNDRGQPLKTNQSWRYTQLQPRIQAQFDGAALEGSAREWRLIIRPAR